MDIYPKELKAGSQRDVCALVSIAALFMIDKRQKQPKSPRADERIKEMRHLCTMEYYLILKRKAILAHAITCMDLEIMLNKISQLQKPNTI